MNPQQEDLLEAFSRAIWDERVRAHQKHGKTSMEQAELLAHRRASILTEEAVECAKALNDHDHGDIHLVADVAYLPGGDELDRELIQTAAMAYTWWANRRGDRLPLPEVAGDRRQPLVEGMLQDRLKMVPGWQFEDSRHTAAALLAAIDSIPYSEPEPEPEETYTLAGNQFIVVIDGIRHVGSVDLKTGYIALEHPL